MAVHQLTCRGCGNQFEFHRRKAYCSVGCRPGKALKGRFENAACNQEHRCKVCDKTFKPKRAGRTTTCGRECGLIWSSTKTAWQKNGGRVWVRTQRNNPEPIRAEPRVYYKPITDGVCRNCGKGFNRTSDGASRYMCSSECRDAGKARAKRAGRKKRRAMERGAKVADTLDPFVVFARDGWRCQICRRKTPRALRGKNMPRSPELDHIVSIANGGSHTYSNTQCLCRECNGAKGADNYGQLNLFPKIQPGGEGSKV